MTRGLKRRHESTDICPTRGTFTRDRRQAIWAASDGALRVWDVPKSFTTEGGGRLMPDRMTMSAAPETLVEGERLDQPTFHALYEATPPGTRAELIDVSGIVARPDRTPGG